MNPPLHNPIWFMDIFGADTNYTYNSKGSIISREFTEKDTPDRYFVQYQKEIKTPVLDSDGNFYGGRYTVSYETVTEEITMESDLGTLARGVYAEGATESDLGKLIIAEVVRNRTFVANQPYGYPEGGETYTDDFDGKRGKDKHQFEFR